MNEKTIVGIRTIKSQKNGKRYMNVYFTYPMIARQQDIQCTGSGVGNELLCPDDNPNFDKIKVGNKVDFVYSKVTYSADGRPFQNVVDVIFKN